MLLLRVVAVAADHRVLILVNLGREREFMQSLLVIVVAALRIAQIGVELKPLL